MELNSDRAHLQGSCQVPDTDTECQGNAAGVNKVLVLLVMVCMMLHGSMVGNTIVGESHWRQQILLLWFTSD
jgi:hypothetical protein